MAGLGASLSGGLQGGGLRKCEIDEINQNRARCGDGNGTPSLIAFSSPTAAKIWSPAKADGTMTMVWSPLLKAYNASVETAWTPGTAGISAYTVNIADDLARTAVRTGGVCWLQNGQLENIKITDRRWREYLDHVALNSGVGDYSNSFRRSGQRAADW
jgi:hypothetical protein